MKKTPKAIRPKRGRPPARKRPACGRGEPQRRPGAGLTRPARSARKRTESRFGAPAGRKLYLGPSSAGSAAHK